MYHYECMDPYAGIMYSIIKHPQLFTRGLPKGVQLLEDLCRNVLCYIMLFVFCNIC